MAGNYKNHGFAVFANHGNIELPELETLIRSKLIDHDWFFADQWKLPDLHFQTWDIELDHTFHEFESIEYTVELPNTDIGIAEFLGSV